MIGKGGSVQQAFQIIMDIFFDATAKVTSERFLEGICSVESETTCRLLYTLSN